MGDSNLDILRRLEKLEEIQTSRANGAYGSTLIVGTIPVTGHFYAIMPLTDDVTVDVSASVAPTSNHSEDFPVPLGTTPQGYWTTITLTESTARALAYHDHPR